MEKKHEQRCLEKKQIEKICYRYDKLYFGDVFMFTLSLFEQRTPDGINKGDSLIWSVIDGPFSGFCNPSYRIWRGNVPKQAGNCWSCLIQDSAEFTINFGIKSCHWRGSLLVARLYWNISWSAGLHRGSLCALYGTFMKIQPLSILRATGPSMVWIWNLFHFGTVRCKYWEK